MSSRKDTSSEDYLENYQIFLDHGNDWDIADSEILDLRSHLSESNLPSVTSLADSVEHEIEYQYNMWNENYSEALGSTRNVLSCLSGDELAGYRAFWNYLAGVAADAASLHGNESMARVARDHFVRASRSVYSRWLMGLPRLIQTQAHVAKHEEDEYDYWLITLIEGLEAQLELLGSANSRKFEKRIKNIQDNLSRSDAVSFEQGHKELGTILGFLSDNSAGNAAPDPWWCIGESFCIVFEDHTNLKERNVQKALGANKVRQAASHPNWIRENVPYLHRNATIIPVIVTPCTRLEDGAAPHTDKLSYWDMNDFRRFATDSLSLVRKLWRSFPGAGNLEWRANAMLGYREMKIAPSDLLARLRSSPLKNLPRS